MKNKQGVQTRCNSDLLNQRVAGGINHCLAISQESPTSFQLYGWGSNQFKCLGKPQGRDTEIQMTPAKILLEHRKQEYVPLQVAVGNQHSMILAYNKSNFDRIICDDKDPNTALDQCFKQLNYDEIVVFSSGADQFGQQGRITDQQEQEEEADQDDDDDDEDYNDEDDEEYFLIDSVVESMTRVVQIACGANFTIALDLLGNVYSWGEGTTGVLGNGNFADVTKPNKIDFSGAPMKFVAAGPAHAASVSAGLGELYTWGIGNFGQLGHGTNKSTNVPQLAIGSLTGKIVDYVACGGLHTACITSDGYAHTFGYNKNGQLGTGDFQDRLLPGKVQSIQNFFAVYCRCGGNTTFITTFERFIYSFGSNMKGRLGLKDDSGANQPEPTQLDSNYFFAKSKEGFIYQMSLSFHYGLALTSNGDLVSFGLPFKGCLGRNLQGELLPKSVDSEQNSIEDLINKYDDDLDDMAENNKKLTEMLANVKPDILSYLIEPKGIEGKFVPMKNADFIGRLSRAVKISQQIVEVKCGAFHTVALTDAGELWVWGSNQNMQHGMTDYQLNEEIKPMLKYVNVTADQKIQVETLPTMVSFFRVMDNKRITYMATGHEYVVVVENLRNVYAWGKNSKGQLGLGFVSDYVELPTKLMDLEGQLIKQIACGEDHTILLVTDGTLLAFGSPADGKLGIGPKQTFVLQAQQIPGLKNVSKVAVGPYHSMALASDPFQNERVIKTSSTNRKDEDDTQKYVIYSWGSGWGGKLGHGNMENQLYPKLLQTKYTFKDISAGSNHSGALNQEDKMIVWGVGAYLSLTKPEEDNDEQPRKFRKGQEPEVLPYFVLSPLLHPDFQTRKYQAIYLFDKYNLALTKPQRKIQEWGLFDQIFQQRIKAAMVGQAQTQRERYVEVQLNNQQLLQSEIQYSMLSCGFNHAMAISSNVIDGVEKREIYSWGLDGMTGRLCLGFDFKNPDKDNEIQLKGKKQDVVTRPPITDIEEYRRQPTQLAFIQSYLDFQYHNILAQQELANKKDDQDEDEEEEAKKKDKQQPTNQEAFQIRKQQSKISARVYIGQSKGIIEKGLIYKMTPEQLLDPKPEIFRCTGHASKKGRVNLFHEKVVDDVYESVIAVEADNQRLYDEIRQIHLANYKNFKEEATLTIINKVQREPFNVKFSKDKKKDSKQSPFKKKEPEHKVEKVQQYIPFTANTLSYKILFTVLQLHPCYLLNIYKNTKISKQDFVDLALDVYGDMENDKRKCRVFISLAIEVLRHDMLKIKESTTISFNYEEQEVNCLYTFTHLFIGYQMQFSQQISLNYKLCEVTEKEIENVIYSGNMVPKPFRNFAMIFIPSQLTDSDALMKPKVDPAQYIKTFEERITFIAKFFTTYMDKFEKELKNELSKSVRELFIKAYELVKPLFLHMQLSTEVIQCKMLGLYFLGFSRVFEKRMQNIEDNKKEEDKIDTRMVNVRCFIELFRSYINQDTTEQDYPWWNNIIDFISGGSAKRQVLFNQIAYGTGMGQQSKSNVTKPLIFSDVNKIRDIYTHAVELNDDYVRPRIKSIAVVTKIIIDKIKVIQYVKAENQDMLNIFLNKLDKNINYGKIDPDPSELEDRISLKLKTRQLYYTKKSLTLKQCQVCNCFCIESFMQSEDIQPIQRFNQWNPVSLAAQMIGIVECFKNKKEFDDFLSGFQPDVALVIKKKVAYQKEQGQFENILKLKEFERTLQDKVQFNIEQSDEVVDDHKAQILRENKKVLKELKITIQERLIQIYLFMHSMEQNMAVLDKINLMLLKKIQEFKSDKVFLYQRILANSYYGLANKEIIKPLEHNPVALVGQIKDAIKKVGTSQEIYENIDIFKKSAQTPCNLQIYGSYKFDVLKYRDIVEKVDHTLANLIKKHTRQQVTDDILAGRLLYLFQKHHDTNLEVILIYTEVSIDWNQTLSCGLIKPVQLYNMQQFEPIEIVIETFEVETSHILEMRKAVIMNQNKDTPTKRRFGKYTHFFEKGFLLLFDELTNHAVIYNHIYQEPQKQKHINTTKG